MTQWKTLTLSELPLKFAERYRLSLLLPRWQWWYILQVPWWISCLTVPYASCFYCIIIIITTIIIIIKIIIIIIRNQIRGRLSSWILHLPTSLVRVRLFCWCKRPSRLVLQKRVHHGTWRHSLINGILWRAIMKAEVPACKEPVGLSRYDGTRPDGATLIPWSHGKPLAMGRHRAGHICSVSHYINCYECRSGRWQGGLF